MFIGFFLASMALLTGTSGHTRGVLPFIAGPVLILPVPIFDATFVVLLRKPSGRAASQGGRDHTSHRLVALGLTERDAVRLLCAVRADLGVLSAEVRAFKVHESIMATFGFMNALGTAPL